MVLNFYGKNLSADEVGKARWGGRGTSISDIESFARSQGFEVYAFFDAKKEELRYLLTQGYPLIVLGVPPPEWYKTGKYSGEGHYVVAVGYDDLKKIFIINDPSPGRKIEIPYDTFKDFHRSHRTHGNYVLCVYPEGK
jgi:predicted double-glycine peptidase